MIDVASFGATGNGVTDDAAAFAAAFASLGAAGGEVRVPNGYRCRIGSPLSVPPNVTLSGPHAFTGSPGDNVSAPYGTMGGALLLAAPLSVGSNAAVRGLLIHRHGMTFPAPDAAGFSGTAIEITGDDAAVERCLILGFALGVRCVGRQRPRLYDLGLDCVSGIEIAECYDVAYVARCHAWPFATIEAVAAGGGGINLTRAGTAYFLRHVADWAKLTDCFAYGYLIGFRASAVAHVTFLGCGADNVPPAIGEASAGFVADGSQEVRLIGCQAAAQGSHGIYISCQPGKHTLVSGCAIWSCGTHGLLIEGGDVTLSDTLIRDTPNGLSITSAAARVTNAGGLRFDGVVVPVNAIGGTSAVLLGAPEHTGPAGAGLGAANVVVPTVPSASVLALPPMGDVFRVSGTTPIGAIAAGWAGRRVTLRFLAGAQVQHSMAGGHAVALAGSATRFFGTNARLSLVHDGAQWWETGRALA